MFKPTVVAHPNAPIFIDKTFMGFAHGNVYDKDQNELVPTNWFWMGSLEGRTVSDFDWQKRIDARMKELATSKPAPDVR